MLRASVRDRAQKSRPCYFMFWKHCTLAFNVKAGDFARAFSSESLPRTWIAGWIPVRVKKTRQNKKESLRSDSIGTEKALVLRPCEESKCSDRDEACSPTVLTEVAMRQSRRLASRPGYDDATRYLYVPQQPAHGCCWSGLSASDVGTIGGAEDKIPPKSKHADQFGRTVLE